MRSLPSVGRLRGSPGNAGSREQEAGAAKKGRDEISQVQEQPSSESPVSNPSASPPPSGQKAVQFSEESLGSRGERGFPRTQPHINECNPLENSNNTSLRQSQEDVCLLVCLIKVQGLRKYTQVNRITAE